MPAMSAEPVVGADRWMSYAEFGVAFFERAVTKERIVGAVGDLVGEPISLGPIGVGPGRLAQVRANGQVGQPSVTRLPGDQVSFGLSVPVELDLRIYLLGERHDFHASISVALRLTARAVRPLGIFIDIAEPSAEDVVVSIAAEGLRAKVLSVVAGIDREIARFVAKYVAREIDKPRLRAGRLIDVAARIDQSYPG